MASQNSVEMRCEQEGCGEKAPSGIRVPEALRKSLNWRLDVLKEWRGRKSSRRRTLPHVIGSKALPKQTACLLCAWSDHSMSFFPRQLGKVH